jgi:hypothetical protein
MICKTQGLKLKKILSYTFLTEFKKKEVNNKKEGCEKQKIKEGW